MSGFLSGVGRRIGDNGTLRPIINRITSVQIPAHVNDEHDDGSYPEGSDTQDRKDIVEITDEREKAVIHGCFGVLTIVSESPEIVTAWSHSHGDHIQT